MVGETKLDRSFIANLISEIKTVFARCTNQTIVGHGACLVVYTAVDFKQAFFAVVRAPEPVCAELALVQADFVGQAFREFDCSENTSVL